MHEIAEALGADGDLGAADVIPGGHSVSVQAREADIVKVDEPKPADAGARQPWTQEPSRTRIKTKTRKQK